jgi:hypothetical protein
MSKKTIAKIWCFVISAAAAMGFFSACSMQSTRADPPAAGPRYGKPTVIGTIRSHDVEESSGIAASRCHPGVLWTHNDSGDDAFIYAIDLYGESLGTWEVPNVENIDWEDIAEGKDPSGKCLIYIGEIGDNKSRRQEHAVYRIAEPDTTHSDRDSDRKHPQQTGAAEVVRFVYPDYNQNAETLMVHPSTGDIYILTKRVSGPAGVYRLKPAFNNNAVAKLEKVTEISVPAIPNGLLTGGDISPDGKRVVLCDYTQGYELRLPDGAVNFDDIWQQTPEPIELGKREHGEGIAYGMDGTSIFADSEGKKSPIIEVKILK